MIEPTGKLKEVLEALPQPYDKAARNHLDGGTSAEWLATTLTEAGFPIGATSIKSYRRKAREASIYEGSVNL